MRINLPLSRFWLGAARLLLARPPPRGWRRCLCRRWRRRQRVIRMAPADRLGSHRLAGAHNQATVLNLIKKVSLRRPLPPSTRPSVRPSSRPPARSFSFVLPTVRLPAAPGARAREPWADMRRELRAVVFVVVVAGGQTTRCAGRK